MTPAAAAGPSAGDGRTRPGQPSQVVDPRRGESRHVHGAAGRHHRQHRHTGDHRGPRRQCQQGLVGDQRLQPGAGGPLPEHGPDLRQVRAEARLRLVRPRRVHAVLAALRHRAEHRVADSLPRRPGRRRRRAGPDLPGHPPGRVPATPARHGSRPLGRPRLSGRRRRPDTRRPPHRVPLLALDLLRQRARGHRRPGPGPLRRPRTTPQPGRARRRRPRHPHLGGGPLRAGAGPHPGQRVGLDLGSHPGPVRRGRRELSAVRLVGAAHDLPDVRLQAASDPLVHGRQHGDVLHRRGAWRLHVPAGAVPRERARLHRAARPPSRSRRCPSRASSSRPT